MVAICWLEPDRNADYYTGICPVCGRSVKQAKSVVDGKGHPAYVGRCPQCRSLLVLDQRPPRVPISDDGVMTLVLPSPGEVELLDLPHDTKTRPEFEGMPVVVEEVTA